MKIVFRTDASLQIGTGHVMRCLTLAEELRSRGHDVVFMSRELEGNLCSFTRSKGFVTVALPKPKVSEWDKSPFHAFWLEVKKAQDARETVDALKALGAVDWLVTDHYALDRTWEEIVHPFCQKLLVIDDLADREHFCDVLVDQTFERETSRPYANLVPKMCQQILGPKHALIRPDFAKARASMKDNESPEAVTAVVYFGGADLTKETEKTLHAFKQVKGPSVRLKVLLGSICQHKAEIIALAKEISGIEIIDHVPNMAEFLAGADLFIGAGGTTTYERCCLGIPAIIIAVAPNQIPNAEGLARLGGQFYLGTSEEVSINALSAAISTLAAQPLLRQHMKQVCRSLVDGKGVARVAKEMQREDVTLRRANESDCQKMYQWRNAPENRAVSFGSEPIPFETHRDWFAKSLSNPARDLLIGQCAGVDFGVLRYDIKGDHAHVSIYLAPEFHGSGRGSALLQAGSEWLCQHRPEVKCILAEVKEENRASKGAFQRAEYVDSFRVLRKELS